MDFISISSRNIIGNVFIIRIYLTLIIMIKIQN